MPAIFLAVGQAAEILRCLAENDFDFHALLSWQRVFYFAALAIFCWHLFYLNFVLLHVKFPTSPPMSERVRRVRAYVPLASAVLPCVLMAAAFWNVSGLHGDDFRLLLNSAEDPGKAGLHYLSFATLGLGVALFFGFREWQKSRGPEQEVSVGRHLEPATRRWLLAMTLVSTLLCYGFYRWPVEIPTALGTAAILFLAASGWVSFGSWIVFLSRMHRVPLLTIMLLVVVASSLVNDNHAIRTVEGKFHSRRPNVNEGFAAWRTNLVQSCPRTNSLRWPVFIVAAEGGGIRAAYWTATVLSELQQADTNFGKHIFAISGVSGGSLGAAVFTGLLAQESKQIRTEAQAILAHDFLAPPIAYMLYPDFLQRFSPFPNAELCRAKALEKAWEKAWENVTDNTAFEKPFDELWRNGHKFPALFLNGTSVEDGKRILTSSLSVEGFNDAHNGHYMLAGAMSVSTAVHMSARFTYFSPAGRFFNGEHVVDGGYFENSGGATADEIRERTGLPTDGLEAMEGYFDPVFIIINSVNAPPQSTPLLSEVFAPVQTLLNTRVARASFSQAELALAPSIQFTLNLQGTSLPLGWQLSKEAMAEMGRQIRGHTNIARVAALLKDK